MRGEADPNFKFERITTGQTNFTSESQVASSPIARADNLVSNNGNRPPDGINGMVWTHGQVNPTLEIESPFYSRYRFVPGKVANYTGNTTVLAGPSWLYRIFFNGEPSTVLDYAVAAGDDFQVYFWTGMPRLYFEDSPPDP